MKKPRRIIRNILVSKSDPILGQRFETQRVEEVEFIKSSPIPSSRLKSAINGLSKKNQKSINIRSCNREGRK